MRDVLLTAVVFAALPFILRNPFIGLLMWVWLGIMNPHRFTWGFAYTMPFAMIVALATFVGLLLHLKKLQPFPLDRVSVFLLLFVVWLGVSPWFSFFPEREFEMWQRPFKILLMTLVALLLLRGRKEIDALVWTLAISLGFFGIKGGIFTLASGGAYRVWGPPESFIEDNNALALATLMIVPFFWYLREHSEKGWIRWFCVLSMFLCLLSALGSHSRGAFLAFFAMVFFLFLKSRQKVPILAVVLLVTPILLYFMPEHWWERMATIRTYQEDASAMGRINAWWVAWRVAVDKFPLGGGFAMWTASVFSQYAPDPTNVKVAHSIYFQILGEHGFIGLFLFLGVFGMSWLNAHWIVRHASREKNHSWARDLAAMCQVSLVGYAVGGAFLSLTYFDLPYYVVVILIVVRRLLRDEILQTHHPVPQKLPSSV